MNAISLHPLLAFGLPSGPDVIVILIILGFLAIPVVGIVLLVTYLNRRKSAQPPPPPPPLPTETATAERLQRLDQLKQQNLVTDAEYNEQRRRIISGV